VASVVGAGAVVISLDIIMDRKNYVLNLCSLGIAEFPFSHRLLSAGWRKATNLR
jgi:hypothetical protein